MQITYNVLSLGIIGAGAIFTGVNPAYSPHELTHHINMVAAKVIIVEPPMLDKTLVAAELCGIPKSNIFVFDIHEGFVHESLQSWSILLQHGESDFVKCNTPDTTVAAYHTTSGTSGLPKAAMIPHSYFIVQAKRRIESHVDYEVS
jgi:long-subunit acyl-CoA synthetase (AMP-forming)